MHQGDVLQDVFLEAHLCPLWLQWTPGRPCAGSLWASPDLLVAVLAKLALSSPLQADLSTYDMSRRQNNKAIDKLYK